MSITIRDETANATVLTIDNSGNTAFGDGTPINMLTLAGYGVIDSDGKITHGVGSGNLLPVSGAASVDYQGSGNASSITISTTAGREPTVQIDSDYPSELVAVLPIFGGPTVTYEIDRTTINQCSVAVASLHSGSFTARNKNTGTSASGGAPAGVPAHSGNFTYRWL